MSRIALLRVTFGSEEEAVRIGRTVVDERLAACVNVATAGRSIYRWRGVVEEAVEAAALFKTREALVAALIERLRALHSYDLPAIEWWLAETSGEVAAWIEGETGAVL